MSSKKDLITPIMIVGDGQCPCCLHSLVICDSESQFIKIDKDGSPIDSEVTFHKVVGYCEHCGHSFKMHRAGIDKYKLSLY